jgi:uncharacterized protein YjbI with pentapeptide repeats
MGRSFRVSEEGLKRAKEAFHLTGWTQEYLAGSVACKRQTVAKFFAGGDVEKRFFEAICRELNLKVAEIADFESEEGQLNTSVSVNGNREQNLVTLTQKQTESDEEKFSFSILGTASKVDIPKLKAIVAHLQKITGDTSIEIVDIEKGSIRLILEGSQESLEQIEALFKSGQLTEVQGIPVQDVQFVTPQIPEPDEDIQTIDRKRLAFIITGSASSEEIQELKAAFTETLDNDKEIEADDKARLVQEIITRRAKDRDLSGAYLRGAILSGAYLRGAILSGADLSGAILSGANLSGAILSGAILSGAILSGANLSGANLSGAILSDANLSGVDLSDADLISANLSDAILSRAILSGAYLSRAILSRAILSGAILSDANLSGVDLSDADLSDANLIGTNLIGADLSDANLSGADLSGADLIGAVVEKSRFGANVGLTEDMKLDLKQRGAIFEDSPGDRSGVLSGR